MEGMTNAYFIQPYVKMCPLWSKWVKLYLVLEKFPEKQILNSGERSESGNFYAISIRSLILRSYNLKAGPND
jgi:hypothetical protein